MTMEEAIEKFHINLEETRNKVLGHIQSNFKSESSVVEFQQLLSILYHDTHRLFDVLPIPIHIQRPSQQSHVGGGGGGLNDRNGNDRYTGGNNYDANNVWYVMVENCKMKACQLAKEMCYHVTSNSSPSTSSNSNSNYPIRTTIIDHHGISSQAAIAQIVELTLRLIIESKQSIVSTFNHHDDTTNTTTCTDDDENSNGNNNETKQELFEITQRYIAYQRSLLRHRSKPSIENIAQVRKHAKQVHLFVSEYIHQSTFSNSNDDNYDDDDDDDNTINQSHGIHQNNNNDQSILDREEYNRFRKQPYAHSITVILGEASSLLHPLMMWLDGIQNIISSLSSNTTTTSHSRDDDDYNSNQNEYIIQSTLMEMCIDTIDILHLEAERLAVTIGNWFIQDHQESLQGKEEEQQNRQNDNTLGKHLLRLQRSEYDLPPELDLTILDKSLDEMAYVCQVIHRYCVFTQHIAQHLEEKKERQNNNDEDEKQQHFKQQDDDDGDNNKMNIKTKFMSKTTLYHHLQEQSLLYSTTETKLTNSNINRAIQIATPVEMVLGVDMYVPSIVDDAFFISQRALERASGTLESKAILTVAHFIVNIWSIDESSIISSGVGGGDSTGTGNSYSHSVYHALLEKKGCIVNEEETKMDKSFHKGANHNGDNTTTRNGSSNHTQNEFTSPKKKGFSFSSVIIEALDCGTAKKENDKKSPLSGSGGPLSGSSLLLSNTPSVDVHKVRMDSQLCNLNGIQAASLACIGIAELFDSLIMTEENDHDGGGENNVSSIDDQTSSMIKLAKEEMIIHSKSYLNLLQHQTHQMVVEWCGNIDDTYTSPPLVASLRQSPCLDRFYFYISNEEYNIGAASDFHRAEADERLEKVLMSPFKDSRLLAQVKEGKCNSNVSMVIMKEISHEVASIFLGTILHQKKKFSEWGSLLLSKQIRMIEQFFCALVLNEDNDPSLIGDAGSIGCCNTSQLLDEFKKIKEAVMILQLHTPSDWSAFAHDSYDHLLDEAEVRAVMELRGDWKLDKIK